VLLEVLDLGHWHALFIGLHLSALQAGVHHQGFAVDFDRLGSHDRPPTSAHLGRGRGDHGDGFVS
jgi:hypothetical protein